MDNGELDLKTDARKVRKIIIRWAEGPKKKGR